MFTTINNHVQAGQARLLSQYINSTNLLNLLAALITPLQTIESVLTDLNTLRALNTASGQQLDNLGTIIGLTRQTGQTDASYLAELYTQIAINLSDGEAAIALQAFISFTGAQDCVVTEFFPAEVIFSSSYEFPTLSQKQALKAILNKCVAVGVLVNGIVRYHTPFFAWANTTTPGGAGWGTVNDPNVGGSFGSLLQP